MGVGLPDHAVATHRVDLTAGKAVHDPGGVSALPQHQAHGSGEVFAMTVLLAEQEVGQRAFGVMVAGEAFSLNRETGEFRQSLTLQDGRTLELMWGYCGRFAKAPF